MGRGDDVTLQQIAHSGSATTFVQRTYSGFQAAGKCTWDDNVHSRFHCTSDAPQLPMYGGTIVAAGSAHMWEAMVTATTSGKRDAAVTGLENYVTRH